MTPYDQLEKRINSLEVEFIKVLEDMRSLIGELDNIDREACYNRMLLAQAFVDSCERSIMYKEDGTRVPVSELTKLKASKEYKSMLRRKLDRYSKGDRPLPNLHDNRTYDELYEAEGGI